ncbi:MAG: hypothetical protein HON90_01730 [Halobacteriovoraceae bacterium]|nr:hypothetical protein [Halobacteriovoraceae bacterium]
MLVTIFASDTFATRIECTTKLTSGRTNNANPKETWCGPINMNIAHNGVKYRRTTQHCSKVQVELFSIKANDEQKFVANCEKIYRRDCYMVGIRDTSNREGLGYLSAHTTFESIEAIPDTFNVTAHAYGRNMGMPEPGVRAWLDLNCRVRH